MKMKVSEATRLVLDWMVAKVEGRLGAWVRDELRPGTIIKDIDFDDRHQLMVYVPGPYAVNGQWRDPYTEWKPSNDWSQGGPIIERECMDILCLAGGDDGWQADKYLHTEKVEQFGPTPLIAAMRCFIASKLGDEVDVPEELL